MYFWQPDCLLLQRSAKIKRADVSKGDIVINDNVNLKGYTNIALFGVDSREGSLDKEAHSDTILIASINNKTKDVKLVSVYRAYLPG